MEWPEAISAALKFMPMLERNWPDFVTEMRGGSSLLISFLQRRSSTTKTDIWVFLTAVAEGAGLPFEDILAMNVRSEISMGMMTMDGCTALSYHSLSTSLLAQNWDVSSPPPPHHLTDTHHSGTSANKPTSSP